MSQEGFLIRFLYQTALGRFGLKIFTQKWFSRAVGRFLNAPISRPLIGPYIKKYGVNIGPYTEQEFRSFNHFFTRQYDHFLATGDVISPCDGILTVYPIEESTTFHIKHTDYSLSQLLDDADLAAEFSGGQCLVFRLPPCYYHRYCYALSGTYLCDRKIDGILHCIRPVAHAHFPVFAQNCREYTLVNSPALGKVIQMEVGALLVGKIVNYPHSQTVHQGAEKGYFEFGGSTVILLVQKNRLILDNQIASATNSEIEVHYGQKIADAIFPIR